MRSVATNVVRVALFGILLWFSVLPYGWLLDLASRMHPALTGRIAVAMMLAEEFFPALVVAVLTAVPIAWLFGRAAVWVAFALCLPTVAVILFSIRSNAGPLELSLHGFQACSYLGLVVTAAVLARRRLAARASRL